MARATGKDHARINLDIWGEDDWLDHTPPAQHLYFVLWTSPQLSYCGTGEWNPGKIAAKARGWTPGQVETAGAELSESLFLVIDTDTSEFILRSWVKHDGLWKQPNLAVSMANARADLASRTLRGVCVFEVQKIRKSNPKLSSWEREAVAQMLGQKAVDASTLPRFTASLTPQLTPALTPPLTPGLTPRLGVNGGVGVDPPADPGATPAPAPTPTSNLQGGNQVGERHQSVEADSNAPPSRFCPAHPNGTEAKCPRCGDARRAGDLWETRRVNARRDEIVACPSCDPNGWLLADDGSPADRQVRCPAHDWETANA